MLKYSRAFWFILTLTLLIVALSEPARADLIYLKDGTVLNGVLRREGKEEVDPNTKEPFFVPKGFYMVDDIARRVYFSPSQVRLVEGKTPVKGEVAVNDRRMDLLGANPLPTFGTVVSAEEWNEKWDRHIVVDNGVRQVKLPQRVSVLTPYHSWVDASKGVVWSSSYLTREMNAKAVLAMLKNHTKYKPVKDEPPVKTLEKRLKICDFMVQTGWTDEAERELARIDEEIPGFTEKIESVRGALAAVQAREGVEEIKRLIVAGQRDRARRTLDSYAIKYAGAAPPTGSWLERVLDLDKAPPRVYADEKTISEMGELKSDLKTIADRLTQIEGLLTTLPTELKADDPNRETFLTIAKTVREELYSDGIGRLESFLGQAAQAARLKALGKKPDLNAEQLLSLAVTGWLLGDVSAETKPEVALRLWRARQLVLDYQRGPTSSKRKELLATYKKEKGDNLTIDEIARLIPFLPPPETGELKENGVLQRTLGEGRSAITYYLQLPPEYRPSRAYPVLFVLHASEEKPLDMLKRFSTMAADHGYILVAPEWNTGFSGIYGFTNKEHLSVLDSLLDLRRRYNVDSDRVFLFGLRQGGLMAWDVGQAHPDLFAGVMPMGAGPEMFVKGYYRNAQYLPFYVVTGDKTGGPNKDTRDLFEIWCTRGYPAIWVQYKGRVAEWFGGELPNLFDWMREKRRAFPARQLGSDGNRTTLGNEFTSMRQGDKSFYWLMADEISDRSVNTASGWRPQISPAMLHARIDPSSNIITLSIHGVKKLTIWLGRTPKGENMIDFDKGVTVRTATAILWNNKKVQPSLDTMLEDLYQRGDRQRLFMARIDLTMP